MTDTDPLITATTGDVERGIRREIFKHPETCAAAEIAEIAMTVVGPVLEAKDDEIHRQRMVIRSAGAAAETAVGERLKVLEENARASEQRRCVDFLDSQGFTDVASLLSNWAASRRAVNTGRRDQT